MNKLSLSQVLKILPNPEKNTFQMMVEIEGVQEQFTMTVETDNLGNHPLQIIQGDDKFHALFQWDRELAQVYNQDHLEFPVSLGDLDLVQEPALNR